MNNPVAEVIEWEETYGHTFKKRKVLRVRLLEALEIGTKLYTHPVKQLSDEEIANIWAEHTKVAGTYDVKDIIFPFARAIIKEITE